MDMDEHNPTGDTAGSEAIPHLRQAILSGKNWPRALMEAMALWTAPEEVYEGTRLVYLIGSEAFDWLTLANRLCAEVDDLVPQDELEVLLFTGRFPAYVDETEFKEIIGSDKYSAYLNYFYGVEVELALQNEVEAEVQKRFYAGGRQYTADHTDAAFQRIYRSGQRELLAAYRDAHGRPHHLIATLTELKEFTYWLFKRRLRVSDKAKIASDTRKGIAALDSAVPVPEEIGTLAS